MTVRKRNPICFRNSESKFHINFHKVTVSNFPYLMMVENQRKELRAQGYKLDWICSASCDGFDLHANWEYRNFN